MTFKHNILILKIILFAAIFLMSTCQALTPGEELKQLLDSSHAMTASFVQTLTTATGKKSKQQTSGSMALERPGRFRWEIHEPNKQLIIVNQKNVWVYDVDLEQVSKQKINYRDPGNPAVLLSGSTATLQNLFFIKKVGDSFQLVPKTKNTMFNWIKLFFRDDKIVAMQVADNLGNITVIHFSNIKLNQVLDANLFVFKTPKGVDVVE